MVFLRKEHKNGVDYYNYDARGIYQGVHTVGNRVIINGRFHLVLTVNSYKFNSELQFSIWSPKKNADGIEIKPIVEQRNDSPYNTTEINIPISELENLIEALKQFRLVLDPNHRTSLIQKTF